MHVSEFLFCHMVCGGGVRARTHAHNDCLLTVSLCGHSCLQSSFLSDSSQIGPLCDLNSVLPL